MHWADVIGWIIPAAAVIGFAVLYVISRGTFSKENESIKDDLIDSRGKKIQDLEKDVVDLKQKDNEQQVMIDKLMKEVEEWKNLPIRQLSQDYHNIAIAVSDMSKLLKVLAEKDSANSKPNKRRT